MLWGALALGLISATAYAKKFDLTVTEGSGSGKYKKNNTAQVWANPNPPGMVFDRWVGDTSALADPLAAHTSLVMPKGGVSITATYKSAPAWAPAREVIGGTTVIYHVPQPHVGVIFCFHGSGGSAATFFRQVENDLFLRDAVAAGFGVIALDSSDRENKQWDNRNPPASNPDLRNVLAVRDTLAGRGVLAAAAPLFSLGISNGGTFASLASEALDFRGAAICIAAGLRAVMATSAVPTVWCLAENDATVGATGSQAASDNFHSLRGRGVPAEFYVNPPSPVYPRRFWRIPGLTPADSEAIYMGLKTGGLLDDKDFLRENPETSNWRAAVPAAYAASLRDIGDQLAVCYAAHKFFSDFDHKIINFFTARL